MLQRTLPAGFTATCLPTKVSSRLRGRLQTARCKAPSLAAA